jgi:hypothetical protein
MSTVNPCSFYVNGSETEAFKFEPGSNMFQVKIYGSRSWIPFSAMLMADDENHVRGILKSLVAFRLECDAKYQAYITERKKIYPDYDVNEGYRTKMVEFTNQIGQWLHGNFDGLPEGFQVIIEQINPNQLFKVSWASNDTLLS